ncbi:type 1 glutamine amidotransferase domain-containing protein [Maribacter aestuarii]|uniref:type 1 glutamine amidotransferase domain-containing protein n=1 Tax=Maribacter aestuarii TaxID=1130723 RepID=UPI00248A9454|nr:type 1 glutamine amidotransferase domain-containing protein [Maribacter aestuarii]
MRKYITVVLLLFTMITFAQSASKNQKNVLIIVSSYGKDNGKTRPGFEFEEFVDAYNIFTSNNSKVTVASPKGGSVVADKFDATKEKNNAFFTNKNTASILSQTVATSQVDADDYDAIYIIGGKGAMFDVPYDPSLQDIILNLYNRKGTVLASVCHGTSAFINVKHQNNYILDNERITGFSNEEEKIFKSKWIDEFPFLLEDAVKSRGAKYQKSSFMLENVVISGKFITGQNPASTKVSAEAVVNALGVKPVQRAKDSKEKLEKGMRLITFGKPYFFNENFQLLVAKTQLNLQNTEQAKKHLKS